MLRTMKSILFNLYFLSLVVIFSCATNFPKQVSAGIGTAGGIGVGKGITQGNSNTFLLTSVSVLYKPSLSHWKIGLKGYADMEFIKAEATEDEDALTTRKSRNYNYGLTLLGGYQIPISESFFIGPLLGVDIISHISDEIRHFADPAFQAGLEFGYTFKRSLSLTLEEDGAERKVQVTDGRNHVLKIEMGLKSASKKTLPSTMYIALEGGWMW